MSSAPTDCRVPDPTDAKADGHFGNHRAGYGVRLDRIIATARKGWTLAAGEGLVLVQEIDRLRDDLKYAQDLLDCMHDGNAKLKGILAALRPLGDVLLRYYNMEASEDEVYAVFCAWRTATSPVSASEREVSG